MAGLQPVILPDINALVYAHRGDSPHHSKALGRLKEVVESPSPFTLCSFVCSGFIRIVTNHRIFVEPSSLDRALDFLEALLQRKNCRMVEPGPQHWVLFKTLLSESRATANLVSDAYLAAIAIENGSSILTADSDFLRFKNLKVERLF